MKATQLLHNLGQCIWLNNITRDLLDSVKSWNELMVVVDSTGALLEKAGG